MRVLLLLLTVIPLSAQNANSPTLSGLSRMFQTLVESVHTSVVQIVTRGFGPEEETNLWRAQRGSGSGVLVDAEGYIVTNAHVVGAVRRVQVLIPELADSRSKLRSVLKPNGKLVNAKVIGIDRETDIAILKVEHKGLPFVKFGDSEAVHQGQLVFAFGSPFGLDNSVTMGVVSSAARQVQADDSMIYIQTDASINPGNSGGPLVNAEGQLIGINTFILSQSGDNNGIGFAAPSNIVRNVYEQIRAHGRVKRGQIGVLAQTITPVLAQTLGLKRDWGVMLTDVIPSSPAESAGLEIKDIILTLNGKTMENARQFGVNIYQNAGQTITVEVLRGEQQKTLKVAVLERPQDPERILSLVTGDTNLVPQLGIVAVELDEKVTPLLPSLRRLSGAVVAGLVADVSSDVDPLQPGDVIYAVNNTAIRSLADLKKAMAAFKHDDPVAVQIERAGRLQFVLLEVE